MLKKKDLFLHSVFTAILLSFTLSCGKMDFSRTGSRNQAGLKPGTEVEEEVGELIRSTSYFSADEVMIARGMCEDLNEHQDWVERSYNPDRYREGNFALKFKECNQVRDDSVSVSANLKKVGGQWVWSLTSSYYKGLFFSEVVNEENRPWADLCRSVQSSGSVDRTFVEGMRIYKYFLSTHDGSGGAGAGEREMRVLQIDNFNGPSGDSYWRVVKKDAYLFEPREKNGVKGRFPVGEILNRQQQNLCQVVVDKITSRFFEQRLMSL